MPARQLAGDGLTLGEGPRSAGRVTLAEKVCRFLSAQTSPPRPPSPSRASSFPPDPIMFGASGFAQ